MINLETIMISFYTIYVHMERLESKDNANCEIFTTYKGPHIIVRMCMCNER